jgi:hypothetical protein
MDIQEELFALQTGAQVLVFISFIVGAMIQVLRS